jgi:hypothetical protein
LLKTNLLEEVLVEIKGGGQKNANLQMSDSSSLKALITANELKCDMYQKSKCNLEGQLNSASIRLDNNCTFTGSELKTTKVNIASEG